MPATLILGTIRACWHLPHFLYVPNYRAMGLVAFPGFALGLLTGAVPLTWLFNCSGGRLLAVALWHALFNVFTASAAGTGTVAAAMSTVVMAWAVALLIVAGRAKPARTGNASTPLVMGSAARS